jgi:predicted RNA-binding Zn ribbon-like protein
MSAPETPREVPALQSTTLCLDFCNTVGGTRADPTESLVSYADLVAWCHGAGVVSDQEGTVLRAAATEQPASATAIFERAIALREAIFRLMSAMVAGRDRASGDLAILNAEVAAGAPYLAVAATEAGHVWVWQLGDTPRLDRPLWALARSAADLLTSEQMSRVRECAGHTCEWLFIDQSRNQSRRWCDMADCGNRAKARRHQARRQAARLACSSSIASAIGPD